MTVELREDGYAFRRLCEREGYRVSGEALKLLADAGWDPEKAAAVVMVANEQQRDPVAWARKFITIAEIVKEG